MESRHLYRANTMAIVRPYRLGIVGHAADKFTPATEQIARQKITKLILHHQPDVVVSGGCHLGGVDIWAIEIADELDIKTQVFLPADKSWSRGYRERNLKIARHCRQVTCIVVGQYPSTYRGRRWQTDEGKIPYCYHCKDRNPPHVKSGGCWTAWKCKKHEWIII